MDQDYKKLDANILRLEITDRLVTAHDAEGKEYQFTLGDYAEIKKITIDGDELQQSELYGKRLRFHRDERCDVQLSDYVKTVEEERANPKLWNENAENIYDNDSRVSPLDQNGDFEHGGNDEEQSKDDDDTRLNRPAEELADEFAAGDGREEPEDSYDEER